MVRKLIKYDFSSYFRILMPVQVILIGIAALNRIIQIFEKDASNTYHIVFYSSLVLYIVSIAALLLMTTIIAIVRFYQGMYSKEGYLSHTLPVTPTQHIFSKLLISVLFYLGSFIAIFLSFMVITLGDVNIEIFKAAGYLLKDYFDSLKFNGALYILELLVLLFALLFATLLKFYFCISVGQLVSRKRILLAFGVYFGIYMASQLFGTIAIIIVSINPSWLVDLMAWFGNHAQIAMHIYLCSACLFEIALSVVYFIFTKLIMSKKLNLT